MKRTILLKKIQNKINKKQMIKLFLNKFNEPMDINESLFDYQKLILYKDPKWHTNMIVYNFPLSKLEKVFTKSFNLIYDDSYLIIMLPERFITAPLDFNKTTPYAIFIFNKKIYKDTNAIFAVWKKGETTEHPIVIWI